MQTTFTIAMCTTFPVGGTSGRHQGTCCLHLQAGRVLAKEMVPVEKKQLLAPDPPRHGRHVRHVGIPLDHRRHRPHGIPRAPAQPQLVFPDIFECDFELEGFASCSANPVSTPE
ncbi:hypothetical protein KC345_g318 [Hortaea werneckii]|nr:hypothetical protein KC345_g318 [Hortaea werneckii]